MILSLTKAIKSPKVFFLAALLLLTETVQADKDPVAPMLRSSGTVGEDLGGSSPAPEGGNLVHAPFGSLSSRRELSPTYVPPDACIPQTAGLEGAKISFGNAIALSADGNIMVVGSPSEGHSSHVKVFRFDGIEWVQMGSQLGGQLSFGGRVYMSPNGSRIAIRSYDVQGTNAGIVVTVYEFKNNDWEQVGAKFERAMGFAFSGDGSRVAVSSFTDTEGSIGIYELQSSSWELIGEEAAIEVQNPDVEKRRTVGSVLFDYSGNRIVLLEAWIDGGKGRVSMYQLVQVVGGSSTLEKTGNDLVGTGTSAFQSIAGSRSLERIVWGKMLSPGDTGTISVGRMDLYQFDGSNWNTMMGLKGDAEREKLGSAVAMSGDGATFAVASEVATKGFVSVYKYDGSKWELDEQLSGSHDTAKFGWAVDIAEDGTKFVVTAQQAKIGDPVRATIFSYGYQDITNLDFACGFTNNPNSGKTYTSVCTRNDSGEVKNWCLKTSRLNNKEIGDKVYNSWRLVGCGCCESHSLPAKDQQYCHEPICTPDMGRKKFNVCNKRGKALVKACIKGKNGIPRTKCASPFNQNIIKCGGC